MTALAAAKNEAPRNEYMDWVGRRADTRWGAWEVTAAFCGATQAFCVKTITVKPGMALSFQAHTGREEYWKILSGRAHVVTGTSQKDAAFKTLGAGEAAFIALGQWHALMNADTTQELVIQEIQAGPLLAETDIQRDGEPVVTNGTLSFKMLAL